MSAPHPTGPDRPLPTASPVVATVRYWRRAVVFTGRASRAEFWWPILANVLAAVVLVLAAGTLSAAGGALRRAGSPVEAVPNALAGVVLLLLSVLAVAQILPGIAVAVRRLHDVDLSGLLVLLGLIPSAGGLILVVLAALPSNPGGRRFDLGARPAPVPAQTSRPIVVTASVPAAPSRPDPVAPPTAPMPQQRDVPTADGVRSVWAGLGEVRSVPSPLQGSGRRPVRTLLLSRPGGIGLLVTEGLAEAEGAAALGPGAELFLPAADLHDEAGAAEDWRSAVLSAVARRIGTSGMHLPAELDQHRILSMAVPVDAPPGWRTDDGAVGVLIGLPLDDVPEVVPTPAGEVRLAGILPLRPQELRWILERGRAAREAVAGDLQALPAAVLADRDRPAV